MRYFLKTFAALALVATLAAVPAAPASADAYADFKAARAAEIAGNFDLAVRLYTRAIESGEPSRKDLATTYNSRGIAYAGKRQHDRAIADYTRAIELSPNFAFAYYNRGNTYQDMRQHDRAIADYTKSIELKPDYASAYGNRGRVHDMKGQRKKAIADYRRAIKLRPNDRVGMAGLKRLGAAQ